MTTISIKEFDIVSMSQTPPTVFVFGPKSDIVVKDLLFEQNPSMGMWVEPRHHAGYDFIPTCFRWDRYDPRVVDRFMDRQSNQSQTLNKERERVFYVLKDECIKQREWDSLSRNPLRCLLATGRLLGISTILAFEYEYVDYFEKLNPLNELPAFMLRNVDYVFAFPSLVPEHRQQLFEKFFSFLDFRMFIAILESCAQNNCWIVLDATKKISLENIMFYQPRNRKGRICSIKAWRWEWELGKLGNQQAKQNLLVIRQFLK